MHRRAVQPRTDCDSRLQFRRILVARLGRLLGGGLGDDRGNLQLFNGGVVSFAGAQPSSAPVIHVRFATGLVKSSGR
jgi:hypothetical protein